MNTYWHHWKQGWKLQLIMLIFNVVAAVALVPLVFFGLSETLYYIVATVIYIIVLLPIGGKLLEVFPARK